ncbi:MAG: hypothetical protein JSW34_06715 [Candidatus Zixiibacteriota bacterium]|nr:MAG: hypothetical protein JSW34_06715 [candidate division Zixibacteria bacterium]
MERYFGSYELPEDSQSDKSAVVMFSIPELGIKFKAPFEGVDHDHTDFASLLALLEFIDSNQKYFSKHTYQIYGNNNKIINQVNLREQPPLMFAPLMQKALDYRKKYRFSLQWVKPDDNPVFQSLFD